MIVRFSSVSVAPARRAALAAVAAALVASTGIQHATAAGVAAAASGASAPAAVAGQYTVRVGQSLNDVAAEVAQTRDPATLARVGRALFDANPGAFMKHGEVKHDPSRLKIGAVLNVPAIPGIAMGASAAATGASAPAGAAVAAAAPHGASAVPAGASAAAAGTAAASSAPVAGGASQAAAAAPAAGGSAAAYASVVAASSSPAAVAGSASAASAGVGASAAAAAAGAPGASAPASSSGAAASGAHVWSGAIQAAPAGAQAPTAVSGAHPQAPVSSIQELLALKNRVLMALQKHGIGRSGQTGGNASPAVASSGSRNAGAPAVGATHGVNAGEIVWLPVAAGIAAAIAVVLLLLLVRRLMRRKPQPPADAGGAPLSTGPSDGGGDATVARAADASGDTRTREAASSAPAATVAAVAASSDVGQQHDEQIDPQRDETFDHATDAAGFAAATSLGADALPPALFESPHGAPLPDNDADRAADTYDSSQAEPPSRDVEPAESETPATAAGAETFSTFAPPPESIETAHVKAEEAEPAQSPHDDDANLRQAEDESHEPADTDKIAAQEAGDTTSSLEPELTTLIADAQPPVAPIEFPAAAVAALDTLDMPLPPRVGEPAGTTPLPTGPAASQEAIRSQSVSLHEPPAPPAGGAIEAGTAGAGSIAGLGAASFGTLSLDFDLNLPPDSAEPLPMFTPEQLARIARNKLDLAHEYIALGDLVGARTLIHEVIESNDAATRADARTLLATLAPMS